MSEQGITLSKLLSLLEEAAPFGKAAPFDNSGLQIGDFERPIDKILLCVDCTLEVVKEAMELGCQAILSHHPLLFHPAKQIVEQFGKQRVMRALIRANIALISAHTNLDYAPDGLCQAMADTIQMTHVRTLITQGEDAGYGKLGFISPQPLFQFAGFCKEAFEATCVKAAGPLDAMVSTAVVGSGKGLSSLLLPAASEGADVIVTADVSYDQALDAVALGLWVVDVGHFDSEKACCSFWQRTLQTAFDALQYPVRLYQAQSSKDVFCQI